MLLGCLNGGNIYWYTINILKLSESRTRWRTLDPGSILKKVVRPGVRRTDKQSKWASRQFCYIYEKNLWDKPEVSNPKCHSLESEVRRLTSRPRFAPPFLYEPQPWLATDGYIEIAHYWELPPRKICSHRERAKLKQRGPSKKIMLNCTDFGLHLFQGDKPFYLHQFILWTTDRCGRKLVYKNVVTNWISRRLGCTKEGLWWEQGSLMNFRYEYWGKVRSSNESSAMVTLRAILLSDRTMSEAVDNVTSAESAVPVCACAVGACLLLAHTPAWSHVLCVWACAVRSPAVVIALSDDFTNRVRTWTR